MKIASEDENKAFPCAYYTTDFRYFPPKNAESIEPCGKCDTCKSLDKARERMDKSYPRKPETALKAWDRAHDCEVFSGRTHIHAQEHQPVCESKKEALDWLKQQERLHFGEIALLKGFAWDNKKYKTPEYFNTIRKALEDG